MPGRQASRSSDRTPRCRWGRFDSCGTPCRAIAALAVVKLIEKRAQWKERAVGAGKTRNLSQFGRRHFALGFSQKLDHRIIRWEAGRTLGRGEFECLRIIKWITGS